VFTAGDGADRLRAAGVDVIELPGLADRARAVNAHLTGRESARNRWPGPAV
jgi:hypothetical protein